MFRDMVSKKFLWKKSDSNGKKQLDFCGITKKRKRGQADTDKRIVIGRKRTKVAADTMEETSDLISNLPEPLIHYIMSYLQTKDATRVSVLSKKWKQIWNSFPVMELDEKCFEVLGEKGYDGRKQLITQRKEKFQTFVKNSLQRHQDRNLCLHKLKLHLISFDQEMTPLLDQWINVSLDTNVRELDFHVQVKRKRYCLPRAVFSSKTITTLSLNGCKLEIENCMELPCLRKLGLKKLHVNALNFQKLMIGCPLMEDLRLISCSGLLHLEVSALSNLCRLELYFCHGLKKVNVQATDLHTFCYCGKKKMPCEINLAACKRLKRLTLEDATMSDESFQKQMCNFPDLEQLVLSGCNNLKMINTLNLNLKSLAIRRCKSLIDAEIFSPKLTSFEYDGDKMPFSTLDPSSLREAKFSIQTANKDFGESCLYAEVVSNMHRFLQRFSHSRGLRLVFHHQKDIAVYEEWKDILVPLVNNLKIEIVKSSMNLNNLVDHLLRTHHPKHLHLVAAQNNDAHKLAEEKIMSKQEELTCCRYYTKKCWRHYLKDAEIESSGATSLENICASGSTLSDTTVKSTLYLHTFLWCSGLPITTLSLNWKK